MSDEYLWDRSGEPDEFTLQLEHTLGQFRLQSPAARRPQPRKIWGLAIAAAIAATFLCVWTLAHRAEVTSCRVSIGGGPAQPMHSGQILHTGGSTHASIESASVGEVDVGPNSRLKLIVSRDNQHRFALEAEPIHAMIWAPPREFVVDTPSAKTIDLGCSYTLRVQKDGSGQLTVDVGWVAFEWRGMESFIPAGAACMTRPNRGPGIPYFIDASDDFRRDLSRFDTTGDAAALNFVLGSARPRDGLTLWHLLERLKGEQRARVFDALARVVSMPASANKGAVVRGDRAALDAAWNALDLADADFWRERKQSW